MSLVTTVANVNSAQDREARLVPEAATQRTFIETASSREAFKNYARSSPATLAKFGITKKNYLRTPNGKGEYAGLWVFPYPPDIWDYWINFRFVQAGRRVYYGEDTNEYIPTPSEPFRRLLPFRGTRVYERKLEYIWDFLYNPEAIMARFAGETGRSSRRREFPVYLDDDGAVSDDGDIMPPYLPDATFPRDFADIYPWAAWELEIDLSTAQIQGDISVALHATRGQRQAFLRAHGRDAGVKETDTSAYRFEPHDATPLLGKVIRPLYPIREASLYQGYFGVPYSPLVLRNLTPFNTNGWIFCYRQAVRYSSDVFLPNAKLWQAFKEANRLMQASSSMSVDFAVALALPRQHRQLFPGLDVTRFRDDFTFPIPEASIDSRVAIDVQTLRRSVQRTREVQDIYELATSPSGPVMENAPYKVVTVQIFERSPKIKQVLSFEQTAVWTLTVPPLLSVGRPSTLEYFSTDATIVWHTTDSSRQLSFMFDGEDVASTHQIRVVSNARGEAVVESRITRVLRTDRRPYRVTYRFELSWFTMLSRVLVLDHALANTQFNLRKELARMGSDKSDYRWLQFTNKTLYAYADEQSRTEAYIIKKWRRYTDMTDWNDTADVGFNLRVDFTRPVVLVRERTRVFLFVFKIEEVVLRVPHFGEYVHFSVAFNAQRDYVIWRRPSNVNVAEVDVIAVSPRQLGRYVAEIRQQGRTGAPDYIVPFLVDIVWNTEIPYGFIQRSTYGDWSESNPAVVNKITERPTTDIVLSYNLRSEYEGAFFEAMIEAWAQNYLIDLRNYARCFPHVLTYCELMDKLATALDAAIVTTLDNNLRMLLPPYMSEPVLLLDLREAAPAVDYAYVVFDPLMGFWINIMGLEQDAVDPSWLPPNHEETKNLWERIARVFPRVSIELQERGRQRLGETSPEWEAIYERRERVQGELAEMRHEWSSVASEVDNVISSTQALFDQATRLFEEDSRGDVIENITLGVTFNFEAELRLAKAYARFVGQILGTCLAYNLQTAPITATVTTQRLRALYTSTRLQAFRQIWDKIVVDFDWLRYGIYACADISSRAGVSLFEQMRNDGYPLSGDYVLYKFVQFVCAYTLVQMSRVEKKRIFDVITVLIDDLFKEKMPLLRDNY